MPDDNNLQGNIVVNYMVIIGYRGSLCNCSKGGRATKMYIRNEQQMTITYEEIFVVNYMVIIANEVCKKGKELQRNIFFSSQEQRLMAIIFEGTFVISYMVIIAYEVCKRELQRNIFVFVLISGINN